MAKNFDDIIDTEKVAENIKESTENRKRQKIVTTAEKKRRLAEGRTQGRAGCSQPRITMAFTSDNYDFLKACAPATGKSIARFVNDIIAAYREQHPELMRTVKYMQAVADVVEYQVDDRKLLENTIRYYGVRSQILMAIEEMAELAKELLKSINRGECNQFQVTEEMADVEIMLDQLKLIYNNSGEVSKQREFKLERLSKRVDILENGGD